MKGHSTTNQQPMMNGAPPWYCEEGCISKPNNRTTKQHNNKQPNNKTTKQSTPNPPTKNKASNQPTNQTYKQPNNKTPKNKNNQTTDTSKQPTTNQIITKSINKISVFYVKINNIL